MSFIERIIVGKVKTNCYIISDNDQILIIDPGDESSKILQILKNKKNISRIKILLTHGHVDHIGAVEKIIEFFIKTEIYVGRAENLFLYDSGINLSRQIGKNIDFSHISNHIQNVATGDEISIGNYHFRVVETPGHTPGSLIFILDDQNIVFTGDTLFKGNVGPTSLPFGDLNKLYTSIKERILILPNNFKVYPGHGDFTTIEIEKETNPFILTMEKEETL